ncbi:hypothetical protein R2F61_01380 [Mollicutes bacterium LVI A0078]|nr:hypothetical protein RZE84_01375 [Mollicutes bacterium LVI A0075]WOO91230.1 hypothetical protein R2F61_01380 [Mollicutes bacterium LVI A0078]
MKLVLDYKNRYLQKQHRFDSLDVEKLVEYLEGEVEVTNFFNLLNSDSSSDDVIVYTSSQVEQYKQYIEDTMYFQNDNLMIPSYEVLKSHENKFFQELYNRKHGIKTNIPAYLLGDKSEFELLIEQDKLKLPFVVKGINGSSSVNVTICETFEEGREAIDKLYKPIVEAYNQLTPTNLHLYPGENSNHRQFIIQEYIELPDFDWRVHIMGDKYWGHKRKLVGDSKYASGKGSENDFSCDIPSFVLNYAKEVFSHIDSPFVILDIVETNNDCALIEWSAIQLGIVSLLNGERYYKLENNQWVRYNEKPNIELEFARSINGYIKENK